MKQTILSAAFASIAISFSFAATTNADVAQIDFKNQLTHEIIGELPPVNTERDTVMMMTSIAELEKLDAFHTTKPLYTVQKGDTISKIASHHNLSVKTIKTWNYLLDDSLIIGQKLSIDGLIELSKEEKLAYDQKKKQLEEQAKLAQETKTIENTPSNTTNASGLIAIAKQYLGVPYVFGGTTPSGFDCSGYISYVFKKAGKLTSHYNAAGLYAIADKVSTPQVGDLVFFSGTYKPGISHVGIYMGDNLMINASGKKVQISNIYDSYWGKHFTGFGRI